MREEAPILTINENGDKYWRNKKGKLHRIDGPAIEYVEGTNQWYQNGKTHRIDGPAVESHNGDKGWFTKGRFHRIDGPAVEMVGYKVWYHCGEKHRIDGPAVYEDEAKRFYLRGKYFKTKEAFFEALSDEEKSIALFSEDFLNA